MARPALSSAVPSSAMDAIDRMVLDGRSILARKRPAYFWEKGFLGKVFKHENLNQIEPFDLDEPEEVACTDVPEAPKQQSLFARLGQETLDPPRSWLAHKDRLRSQEISEWVPKLLAQPLGSELSQQLAGSQAQGAATLRLERQLGAWLSSRDALTLKKHRRAFCSEYSDWAMSADIKDEFLPANLEHAVRHAEWLWDHEAAGSRTIQFHKSCLFAAHVLGAASLLGVEGSARMLGFLAAARRSLRTRAKRRALRVAEVGMLEHVVSDEKAKVADRMLAGVFLFQIYARARWHELAAVSSMVADHAAEDGFTEALASQRIAIAEKSLRFQIAKY